MALVYFDASALVKLVVTEPGSDLASALYHRADVVVTSRLADVEVRAALGAAARTGLLDPGGHTRALSAWERLWPTFAVVELGEEVSRAAAGLLAAGLALRADDAVHVASARTLAHPQTVVAAWDDQVASAVRAQAMTVLP